jgi:hypothetical protein
MPTESVLFFTTVHAVASVYISLARRVSLVTSAAKELRGVFS